MTKSSFILRIMVNELLLIPIVICSEYRLLLMYLFREINTSTASATSFLSVTVCSIRLPLKTCASLYLYQFFKKSIAVIENLRSFPRSHRFAKLPPKVNNFVPDKAYEEIVSRCTKTYSEKQFTEMQRSQGQNYSPFGAFAPYFDRPLRRASTPVASYLPRTTV